MRGPEAALSHSQMTTFV